MHETKEKEKKVRMFVVLFDLLKFRKIDKYFSKCTKFLYIKGVWNTTHITYICISIQVIDNFDYTKIKKNKYIDLYIYNIYLFKNIPHSK